MKYAIWDKNSSIITPMGTIYTASQWIDKYPVAALPEITVVCGSGIINGSFFGILEQMVQNYERLGHSFSDCSTAEEKLAKIEEIEDIRNTEPASTIPNSDESLASIAASLEFQNMMMLPEVEGGI